MNFVLVVTAAEKKAWIVFLVLLGLTAAVLIISAGLGQRFIPPWDVAKTFFGAGSKLDELMIMSFRMPRILTLYAPVSAWQRQARYCRGSSETLSHLRILSE